MNWGWGGSTSCSPEQFRECLVVWAASKGLNISTVLLTSNDDPAHVSVRVDVGQIEFRRKLSGWIMTRVDPQKPGDKIGAALLRRYATEMLRYAQ